MILQKIADSIVVGADSMVGAYLVPALASAPAGATPRVAYFCLPPADQVELPVDVDAFVFLSSWRVYGLDAGRDVDESAPLFAADAEGRAYARAEKLIADHARNLGKPLAILRAANLFGNGISGPMLGLFNRAIRGHYVHVRGNDAMLSAVTALDAAAVMQLMAGRNGIFNLSDGQEYTWPQLVTAMTANAGAEKRPVTLPAKWVKWINRIFGRLPIVAETMSEAAQKPVSQTLTLSTERLRNALNYDFHPTLEVIARRDATYPYSSPAK